MPLLQQHQATLRTGGSVVAAGLAGTDGVRDAGNGGTGGLGAAAGNVVEAGNRCGAGAGAGAAGRRAVVLGAGWALFSAGRASLFSLLKCSRYAATASA